MTKQKKHHDIDAGSSLFRSANSLYQSSLEMIQLARSNPQAYNKFKIEVFYQVIGYNLQESLLFGKAESAAGLAFLYQHGLGVTQDEYAYKLFIAIGSKLGDTETQRLFLAGKDYSMVEKEANVWVKIIKEIGKKYPNKDNEITDVMVVEAQEKFNAVLPGRLISAPSQAEITQINDNNDQPGTASASTNQVVVNKKVSTLTTIQKHTAKKYQDQGQSYLEDIVQEQDTIIIPAEEVDNRLERIHKSFWFALALGSEKAPFCLFQCLLKAVGGKKDEDLATLMYGVALKLTPKDCSNIKPNERPIIPQHMTSKITTLAKLIKETKANMPQEGVDDAAFNSLLLKCNDEIVGITGKRIPDCFNENTPAASTTHASSILPSGSGTSYMITDREITQKLWTKLGSVPPHKLAYSATILAEAEEAFAEARSLLKVQKASESPLARIKLKETIDKLISALALGEQDAAEYLAGICYHYPDYEIEKNEKLTQLFIAIGEILESTVQLPLINSENYITIDKVDELKTHPNYPEAVKLAKKYTAVIIKNQKKYINKQEIPVEKLQEAVTRFKEAEPSQIIKNFNLQISARAASNTVENDLEEHIEVPVDPAALNHLLLAADQQQEVTSLGVESSSWCSCCSGCAIM